MEIVIGGFWHPDLGRVEMEIVIGASWQEEMETEIEGSSWHLEQAGMETEIEGSS